MTKTLFVTIACLLAVLSAGAQNNREKVELLLMEENTAVFSSDGFASNKKDALENATKAAFRRLLYDGVHDFNGGDPIVVSGQETNIWLKEFFNGKQPAYKAFVDGVELVGDFSTSPSGEICCTANIVVKYTLLMQRAAAQGLTGNSQSQKPASESQQTGKPKKSFL